MRTLIISHGHPSFSIGGAEVASHTLFRALASEPDQDAYYLSRAPSFAGRFSATPLMGLGHSEYETFISTGQWDEFWLSNAGLSDLAGAFSTYLKRVAPDIIHFHHVIGLGVEAIAIARRVLPFAKIVITFHEYLSICANHGQMIKTTRRELCRSASPSSCAGCFPNRTSGEFLERETHIKGHLLLADAYVSPSQFLIERYVAWGLPRERFSLIENGVGGGSVRIRPIGSGGKRNRFAFFGQITEFKGLQIVLDAIARIPEALWGEATLSVYGGNLEFQPEAFRSRFEALMERAGRRARFFGSYRQDELPELMADVDWVIMPSIWWENSPVVIQEAFLHRRPLIVSSIGGMKEKVREDVDGLHFRVSSPESLSDKISQALTDDELWARLADQAPTPLSPEAFAREHLDLYEAISSRRSRPASTAILSDFNA